MSTDKETTARLFRVAVDRAVEKIGKNVFCFQQPPIQQALVAQEILILVNSQDDDVSDARVRQMVQELSDELAVWGRRRAQRRG